MPSLVSKVPAASRDQAQKHFQHKLELETDCSDVHDAISKNIKDFVLVDTRGPLSFAKGHLPTAINMPYREINIDNLAAYAKDTLFVVYCAGPHCNAAQKGALMFAELGRPVKEMIGGIEGWKDEGFELVVK